MSASGADDAPLGSRDATRAPSGGSGAAPAHDAEVRAELRRVLRSAVAEVDRLLGAELAPEPRSAAQRLAALTEAALRLASHDAASSRPLAASRPPVSAADRPRILLVEDNEVNQRVTKLLLQKRGYAVDVAADGHEAVEATGRAEYAAILMDCHMPRYDGYAATSEIRKHAGARARVPIIAMTANAGPGARERCLAAGMDDYVAKPVSLDALDAVLRRWVAVAPPPPAPLSRRSSAPPVDLGMLRKLRTGPEAAGHDIVSEVISIFRQDAPRRLASLREAASRGDLAEAARAAHTLKGSAGHLGAKSLAALCARFEEKARGGAALEVTSAIQAIADELERVQAALVVERREESVGPTTPSASSKHGEARASMAPGSAG